MICAGISSWLIAITMMLFVLGTQGQCAPPANVNQGVYWGNVKLQNGIDINVYHEDDTTVVAKFGSCDTELFLAASPGDCNDHYGIDADHRATPLTCFEAPVCYNHGGSALASCDPSLCTSPPCNKLYSATASVTRTSSLPAQSRETSNVDSAVTLTYRYTYTFPWVFSISEPVAASAPTPAGPTPGGPTPGGPTPGGPTPAGPTPGGPTPGGPSSPAGVYTSQTYITSVIYTQPAGTVNGFWTITLLVDSDLAYELTTTATGNNINGAPFTITGCDSTINTICRQTITITSPNCNGLSLFAENHQFNGLTVTCKGADGCMTQDGSAATVDQLTIQINSANVVCNGGDGGDLRPEHVTMDKTDSAFQNPQASPSFTVGDTVYFLVGLTDGWANSLHTISGISVTSLEATYNGNTYTLTPIVRGTGSPSNQATVSYDTDNLDFSPTTGTDVTFTAIVEISFLPTTGGTKRSTISSSYLASTSVMVVDDDFEGGSQGNMAMGLFCTLMAIIISVFYC